MSKEINRFWCSIAAHHIRKGEPLTGILADWLAGALDKVAEGGSADKALGLVGRGRKRVDHFIERDMDIYDFISEFDTGNRGDLTKGYDLATAKFPLEKETIIAIYQRMKEAMRAYHQVD